MNIRQGLQMGIEEIRAHRLRTGLTMLGVIFGVATFIALFSIMEGSFEKQRFWLLENGGLQQVKIQERGLDRDEQLALDGNRSQGRVLSDARAVLDHSSRVDAASPEIEEWLPLSRKGREKWSKILAGNQATITMEHFTIAEGRGLCDMDRIHASRVCVLGSKTAQEAFGTEDPVGKWIAISGVPFEVVGLLKKRSHMFGNWDALEWKNGVCFIPIESSLRRFKGTEKLGGLRLWVEHPEDLPWAVDQARRALKRAHGVEDFRIETNEGWSENLESQQTMFRTILAIIGGICLLSGGIGIMNIMLATVNERTREIGIRRALGARRKDILAQFMLETLLLACSGGVLGVLLGLVLAAAISLLPQQSAIIRFGPPATAFAAAIAVSLLFGIYPALRASKLDPIEALRYE